MPRKAEKSGKVQRLLDEIESLDAEEQAVKLCRLIERIDMTKGRATKQVATADVLLRRTMQICRNQGKHLLGLNLPISAREKNILQHFLKALALINAIYQNAFDAIIAPDREREAEDRAYLGRCLAGRCLCAREVLLLSATAHLNWPGNIWFCLHKTWMQARKLELANEQSPISQNRLTIEEIYIACLLLGLSDPYRLPFRGIHVLHKTMLRILDGAKIRETDSVHPDRVLFLLRTKEDKPGIPLHNVDTSKISGSNLFLDVTTFIARAQSLYNDIDKIKKGDDSTCGKDVERTMEILAHLKKSLGIRPARITNRSPDHGHYHFHTGFLNVRSLLSTEVSNAGTVPEPGCACGVDRSENGLKLRLTINLDYKVRAGDVIVIRSAGAPDEQFTAGFVRWVRGGGSKPLEFGIEKVPGIPLEATLNMREEDDPMLEHDDVRSIAVVDDIESPDFAMVIAPESMEHIQKLKEIWLHDRIRGIVSYKKVMEESGFTLVALELVPLQTSQSARKRA